MPISEAYISAITLPDGRIYDVKDKKAHVVVEAAEPNKVWKTDSNGKPSWGEIEASEPIEVEKNSDMDDYTEPGTYWASGDEDLSTLTNSPFATDSYKGFNMDVLKVGGTLSQIATAYTGDMVMRHYEHWENPPKWTAWKSIDTTSLGSMTGTLGIAHGGTGKTTGADAANVLLNSLSAGTSDPVDADYYISQYAGGGTTTTTYHRRPVSALWNYIKGKIASWCKNNTSVGHLGWQNGTADKIPITSNTLAYWNGRYSANGSNLAYCSKGAFGNLAVKDSISKSDVTTALGYTPPTTNTWNANSKSVAGYVSAPGAVANKVWKTDASGNPGWRDDANTTYDVGRTSGTLTWATGIAYTNYGSSLWRVGKCGYLYLNIVFSSYTVQKPICTLPSGFRPAATMDFNVIPNSGSEHPYLRLNSANGEVSIMANFTVSVSGGIRALISYPVT